MLCLFSNSTVVFSIIYPIAYIDVNTVTGFLDSDCKSMTLTTDKGEFFFHVKILSVNRYSK